MGHRVPRLSALAVVLVACVAPGGVAPGGEPSFGLGDKADGGGCDSTSELCWPTADAEAYRGYLAATDAAMLGDGFAAVDAVSTLEALTHKLEPAELDALEALRAAPVDDPAAFAAALHGRVTERISTGFLAAHAVPLGAAAQTGRADAADVGQASPATAGDVAESLDLLRAGGVFGRAYALMLEVTGVLDVRYFTTIDDGLPREERVRQIIERYTASSTRAAVLVNAEALVPYAGIVISVAHGSYMQFRLRARMVFEIAAVYGIDVHEGHNLVLATGAMMGAYGLQELRLLWGGTLALPFIVKAVLRAGRLVDPRALLRRLAERAVASILEAIGRASARAGGRVAAQAAARGVARQVLGYATLGLAIVGDVWLTRSSTRKLGEHVARTFRPWVTGMLAEGATWTADEQTAACVATALGATAAGDGAVSSDERRLLAARLARPTFVGDRWTPATEAQVDAGALIASRGTEGELVRCLSRTLRGRDVEDRLSMLSWMRAMAAVDGELSPAEDAVYQRAVTALRGDAWFGDGDALDEEQLAILQARAEVVVDPYSAVSADAAELLRGVRSEDLFDELERAPDWAVERVEAAFGR